ncbi:MAG TPA: maleylpyruvate isomerase family mycothiol-dependent enzyme [Acidimicrobiales bacterium]|jgi:uncharacterized protein (TIGR03083 family)
MPTAAVSNLAECADSLLALLGDLSDGEWEAQSLCPEWRVRDVVSHLGGIESALLGWRPEGERPAPFELVEPWMRAAREWSHAALLARFAAVLAERREELGSMEEADFAATSWTPVGIQTYGGFMAIRVFDFWVHEQDIRVPLDRPGHQGGPAAEMALDQVRSSFGYIVGKRAGVPDGRAVTIDLTGPVTARLSAIVEGRARVVDHLEHPDAVLTTDFLTFMLLACGRVDPTEILQRGLVRCEGDPALADQLARGLRFTM